MPKASAFSLLIKTTAAAPSFRPDALPAVTLKDGSRVQTGTVATMLYNIALYNAGERGAVEEELKMAIPTLFASFWGMNTAVPFQGTTWGFWAVVSLSLVAALGAFFVLWKKKMF